MEEDELERLAREEILRETQRASARADEVGPQGWMKCPVPPANKRFLHNTLLSTLSNKTQDATASPGTTKSKCNESKSRNRDKNECQPESSKDKTNKRPHSKASLSKSPKKAKTERQNSTRLKAVMAM